MKSAESNQSSDPAHGIGPDGRTVLQSRLTTYALALLLFYLAYYPSFYLIWSRDPGFGSRAARRPGSGRRPPLVHRAPGDAGHRARNMSSALPATQESDRVALALYASIA